MNDTDQILKNKPLDDVIEFAKYLGVDPEDYLESLEEGVDMDDLSR
jgi:hypothetical protein